MSDESSPKNNPSSKHTTHDMREAAEEALRRFNKRQTSELDALRKNPPIIDGHVVVKLDIENVPEPLVLRIEKEAVIGRRDPNTNTGPVVDLATQGAYQMGVSRRHAVLRIQNKRLELTDLGSRNGTFVNGRRLTPHQSIHVVDGDEIQFGKISLKLGIQADTETP